MPNTVSHVKGGLAQFLASTHEMLLTRFLPGRLTNEAPRYCPMTSRDKMAPRE